MSDVVRAPSSALSVLTQENNMDMRHLLMGYKAEEDPALAMLMLLDR